MPSYSARSRSRSPHRTSKPHRARTDEKERSHHHRHHHSHHRSRKEEPTDYNRPLSPIPLPPRPVVLPFKSPKLSKHDLTEYLPLFASYLDIQKQKILEDLPEDEIKGRWKSFTGKWNRGEVAEGWYDPSTKERAIESAKIFHEAEASRAQQGCKSPSFTNEDSRVQDSDDDDDNEYGPVQLHATRGPSAPNFQELALRAELDAEQSSEQRQMIREARKSDRKVQRERLDDVAPRAEPGTRERQLEKKRENASVARSFRDAKGGPGELEEIGENELIGEGGGVDDLKRVKKESERKKNEREVRREEILRARALEREERLAVHREKESKTMEMLKAIAQERFGS